MGKNIKRVVDLPKVLDREVKEEFPGRKVNCASTYFAGMEIGYNALYRKDYENGVVVSVKISDYEKDKRDPDIEYRILAIDNNENVLYGENADKESELKARVNKIGGYIFKSANKTTEADTERVF